MSDLKISNYAIRGYDRRFLGRFFRLGEEPGSRLAVLFPGLQYTADMPLLYYPTQLFLQHDFDVLQVHADYTDEVFRSAGGNRQSQWLAMESDAALQFGREQGEYRDAVLLGKSLGTLSVAHLTSNSNQDISAAFWLTPLFYEDQLIHSAMKTNNTSLFVCGQADPLYDAQALERIQSATGASALIIQGADHSLLLEDDIIGSLPVMSQVLKAMEAFL